jgi:antitoxin component YwqK of YwqJK toxin-antitoxin module
MEIKIMRKILLLFYFISVTCVTAYSNNSNLIYVKGDTTNVISNDGKKQGYWIEYKDNLRFEMYYHNDTLNGVHKTFYQNNVISSFGFYTNGEKTGVWYFFDEKGRLILEQSQIKKVKYSKKTEGELVEYNNSSYIKYYFNNGRLKEEGFAFYNDVEEHVQKYGIWKTYDEDGKKFKTETYNKAQ